MYGTDYYMHIIIVVDGHMAYAATRGWVVSHYIVLGRLYPWIPTTG